MLRPLVTVPAQAREALLRCFSLESVSGALLVAAVPGFSWMRGSLDRPPT